MKHTIILSMLLAATSYQTSAGIYRHDVPAEKYRAFAKESQFNCVGQVVMDRKAFNEDDPASAHTKLKKADKFVGSGSCVLIGGQYVLTAAHIFVETESRAEDIVDNGHNVTLYHIVGRKVGDARNYYFRFNGKQYRGSSFTIFPGYADSTAKDHHDLAVVKLETSVIGIQPAVLSETMDELHAKVAGAGYGASGVASKPENVHAKAEKIAGENVVDEFNGALYNGQPTLLNCDFDHATKVAECNKMGDGKPMPLEYITTGGDSGCGLFRQTNTGWKLIAILTGGGTNIDQLLKTGYYGQRMQFTRVSVFIDWIKQQMH